MAGNNCAARYFRVSQARDGMKAPELYENEIKRFCRYRHLDLKEIFFELDRSVTPGPRTAPH